MHNKYRTQCSILSLLVMVMTPSMADPTPVADENLLLFLAEMVEVEGELTDGMDLISMQIDQEEKPGMSTSALQQPPKESGDP